MILNSWKFWKDLVIWIDIVAAILLGSVKVPYEEIKRRIVEVDEEQLSSHMIEQLIQYMPSPDQMSQLAGLKDEYATLAESEQFAVVVSHCFPFSFYFSWALYFNNSQLWVKVGANLKIISRGLQTCEIVLFL